MWKTKITTGVLKARWFSYLFFTASVIKRTVSRYQQTTGCFYVNLNNFTMTGYKITLFFFSISSTLHLKISNCCFLYTSNGINSPKCKKCQLNTRLMNTAPTTKTGNTDFTHAKPKISTDVTFLLKWTLSIFFSNAFLNIPLQAHMLGSYNYLVFIKPEKI